MKKRIGLVCLSFGAVLAVLICSAGICADMFIQPLRGWRIMVDPGLGNELSQVPFVSKISKSEVSEPETNMRVALFLIEFLKNAGAEAILSYEKGQQLSVEERLKKAEDFKANWIISIHHDEDKDSQINYVKAFYHPAGKEPNVSMARNIAVQLAEETGQPGRGADVFAYQLLTRSTIPAVMINCGFISNPESAKKLKTLDFNRTEAVAILKGILKFEEDSRKAASSSIPFVPAPSAAVPGSAPVAALPPLNIQPTAAAPLPALPPSGIQPAPAAPAVPLILPPMPQPKTPEPATPAPTEAPMALPSENFEPPLINPTGGPVDQTWLYAESLKPYSPRRGISFAVDAGCEVKASADGEVVEASDTPPIAVPEYTNCVIIKHFGVVSQIPTIFTVYGRLSTIKVKKGDKVKQGDVIGITGPHFSKTKVRDKDFEFQVRWGNINDKCIVNPELFIKPLGKNTGIIIGQFLQNTGDPYPDMKIFGVIKLDVCKEYYYTLTYARGLPSSEIFKENFVIGDVPAGDYTLTTQLGTRSARVEPGKITLLSWKLE
ncbi:MAG TPA: N-acetylmuramoyl-L-alanine amidase [Candidatus Sumerlaeia bacterium]|nr:N-acetylmuramoyl-L-alanine amidase [Candidatus Sumerlaeia bacterium]